MSWSAVEEELASWSKRISPTKNAGSSTNSLDWSQVDHTCETNAVVLDFVVHRTSMMTVDAGEKLWLRLDAARGEHASQPQPLVVFGDQGRASYVETDEVELVGQPLPDVSLPVITLAASITVTVIAAKREPQTQENEVAGFFFSSPWLQLSASFNADRPFVRRHFKREPGAICHSRKLNVIFQSP